jgi:predicted ATP-grasp superfamily ATP-dependent carboligase
MRVLLTDGNFKHTLAATRSLGKRGIDVSVVSHHPFSVSFHSRYCSNRIIGPDPEKNTGFGDFILAQVKKETYDVLLPISYAAISQVSLIRDELIQHVRIPIAGKTELDVAADKAKTFRLAGELGMTIPGTWYPENETDLSAIADTASYPLVVKGSIESGNVAYVNSSQELTAEYRRIARFSPIVQEYIPGEGFGFFALYNHGAANAIFMHRRIREYPVSGGPSTCAESIYDEDLKKEGLRILDALGWHGVAMVEFKKDARSGEYVLMEINPKFWGSLELAIASGVDFPWLACRMAIEGSIDPVFTYRTGVRFHWPFPGDLFHALVIPKTVPQILRESLDPEVRSDIDPRDIAPTIYQIGMSAGELFIRITQGRFWRPHGVPAR